MSQKQEQSSYLLLGQAGIKFQADDLDEERILGLLFEALQLRRRKGQDYGKDSWKDLGARGEFPYLWHKVKRLRTLLWEAQRAPNYESVKDNLIDLINYSLHTLLLLEEEKQCS